ncbi:NUAK SNF1-like kinase 1 [Phytophthora pseudosyringae]|uniref:NUAK SNF1-like kinase 1 n=1 Tax=Phytophthora pseudosyringae TaxID=221518 RepID=A0A8T1VX23_9STRA|nr:NUAK SNF1-like kinase 1 [Phytophthora pseudosyringae]
MWGTLNTKVRDLGTRRRKRDKLAVLHRMRLVGLFVTRSSNGARAKRDVPHTKTQFADMDPLAALEAEYAAVLAQTRPPAEAPAPPQQPGDAESAGSESEDEESAAVGGFESYALLPSSPCNSEDEAPETSPSFKDNSDREEDAEERPQSETEAEDASTQQEDAGLQEDKRLAIMQSMRQVKLRPPPWAEAASLTDDELVDMVQRQLGLKSEST